MTDESPTTDDGAQPRELTLSATPTEALLDRPLDVTLTGLSPGERATLTAEFVDDGAEWRCEATFEADADGAVDPSAQTPVAGDYDGVRPMGLVQFATEAEDGTTGDAEVANTDGANADETGGEQRLLLTARVNGECVAEATVTRRTRGPGVERVELDPEQDGLVGECFVPAGDGPHPGVVALHGSGGTPPVRFAELLASRGVAAVALRYFGDPGPIPDRLVEVPVSYVGDAIDWLRVRDDVTAAEVGLLGVSRGTELAFLAAASRDDVGAVVAYAPSAYVWPGDGPDGETPAAWSVDGDPRPPVPYPAGDPSPATTERGTRPRSVFDTCLAYASDDELAATALPAAAVDADVLLISGRDDGIWPADEMGELLADRLRERTSEAGATPGEVTHLCFEDYGHQAGVPYRPTTGRAAATDDRGRTIVSGGTPAGIADAEVRSWRAVLDALGGLAGGGSVERPTETPD